MIFLHINCVYLVCKSGGLFGGFRTLRFRKPLPVLTWINIGSNLRFEASDSPIVGGHDSNLWVRVTYKIIPERAPAEFARMVYFHFGMSRCLLDKLVAILYELKKRVHRVPSFPGILPPNSVRFWCLFCLQKVSSQLVLLPIGSQRWSWTTCLMALGVLESKSGINVYNCLYLAV